MSKNFLRGGDQGKVVGQLALEGSHGLGGWVGPLMNCICLLTVCVCVKGENGLTEWKTTAPHEAQLALLSAGTFSECLPPIAAIAAEVFKLVTLQQTWMQSRWKMS